MQFQQLLYFVAVAETRHFTRAAERVHVSQPSLSQQIKALEQELGAELFSRARGNITLTDAGEALLPLARRILADTETARIEVQELAQLKRGRVRLGATPSLCTGLLPDVLRAFHDLHPGIELLIEEGGSHDLVRELARGALDLALVVLPLPTPSPALTTVELLREDLVVVSSASAPAPRHHRRDDREPEPGRGCAGRSPWRTGATWHRRGRRGSSSACCSPRAGAARTGRRRRRPGPASPAEGRRGEAGAR